MLGRMEVTAQRIEAREASSRVEQTATYSLPPSSSDSVMEREDGEARRTPAVLSISHLIVFSVVSCLSRRMLRRSRPSRSMHVMSSRKRATPTQTR